MGKPCRNIRAQWTTEDLQNAIAATTNGSSVAEAARRFNIPRRTLRDWIRRGNANEPVRKLGRNPVFTTEIENQLKFRIVRLQQVGFGVTKQFICEKGAEISEALKVKNPFSKGEAGRYWFKGFLKRNPDIVLRKGENLSYGRLMRFNKQIVEHFFSLLRSVYEKSELQPQQIYNVDESGLQLCFSSTNKVLALKGSKRVHVATHGEHGETVTVIACTNATGSSWIPPMVLYKGVYEKKEFGDDLPQGSVFCMTPKGYVTTEVFCKFLRHFNNFRTPGSCLLILDGHKSHMDEAILNVADELGIEILCLPAHCSHELQPLDKSFFKPLKVYWNQALDTFRRQHPGRSVTKLQFPKLFSEAWYRASTPANAISGFRATGIYPFNSNIFPECAFAPSCVSEREKPASSTPPTNEISSPESSNRSTPKKSPVYTLLSTPKIVRKVVKRKSLNSKATILNRKLFDHDAPSMSKPSTSKIHTVQQNKRQLSKDNDKTLYCGDCGGYYYDKRSKKNWIECLECKTWFHETCDNSCVQKTGLCSLCEEGCDC